MINSKYFPTNEKAAKFKNDKFCIITINYCIEYFDTTI